MRFTSLRSGAVASVANAPMSSFSRRRTPRSGFTTCSRQTRVASSSAATWASSSMRPQSAR
jgi:hypothetical protein